MNKGRRVPSARVVLADYDLLRNDFPQLRPDFLVARNPGLAGLPVREMELRMRSLIDRWLVLHGAIISKRQAFQTVANTEIKVEGEDLLIHRPPRYGRSIVVQVRDLETGMPQADRERWRDQPPGLLDVKGGGVAPRFRPRPGTHTTGLMFLGEALHDYCLQYLVESALRHSGEEYRTLPTYAVLDLGFDIKMEADERRPEGQLFTGHAGVQLRRAHRRPKGGNELPPRGSMAQRVKLEVELLLRHFGVTTNNAGSSYEFELVDGELQIKYGGRPLGRNDEERKAIIRSFLGDTPPQRVEGINVQLTREVDTPSARCTLLDFGHLQVRENFERPVLSLVGDRMLRWGGILHPDDPGFVVPDPKLSFDYELWGRPMFPEADETPDNGHPDDIPHDNADAATLLCYSVARDFRAGRMDRLEAEATLQNLCARSVSHLIR